jgi:Flp pilus assembly protein TadG
MIRRLFKLGRSEDGSAVVELAVIAPVLATLVIGITDISIAYSRKLELQQAVQRAIEKVMQTTGLDTEEATIKTEACIQINGSRTVSTTTPVTDPVTNVTTNVTTNSIVCDSGRVSTADVTVKYTLTCDNVEMSNFSADCPTGQAEARYIEATIVDTYTPMFSKHFGTHADGTYHLSETAGVRVE